jgi:peptidoglycan hydrolase-like protein with peptidoglycan-binding domain
MSLKHRIPSSWLGRTFLAIGMLGLCSTAVLSAEDAGKMQPALQQKDIQEIQKSLSDKGFDTGPADGYLGPRTRAGIRQYQESEKLPVTGRLDAETAGKLGVGPESIGGEFSGAGHDVAEGSKELAHEVSQGKPVAAGKEFGKGIGRAAQKVGEGVVKAVSPESDRGDREEQQQKKESPLKKQ